MTNLNWSVIWGGWLIYFAIAEFWAIRTVGTAGTFSYWVWELLNVADGFYKNGHVNWRLVVGLVFMGWLLSHFIFEKTRF